MVVKDVQNQEVVAKVRQKRDSNKLYDKQIMRHTTAKFDKKTTLCNVKHADTANKVLQAVGVSWECIWWTDVGIFLV